VRFRWGTGLAISGAWLNFRASTTVLLSVRINTSTGLIELYTSTTTKVATSSIPTQADTWYCVELHVKVADSLGVFDLRIDGISAATFSGDTKPGADTTVDNILVNFAAGGSGNFWLDDIALNDTTGVAENDWCGLGRYAAGLYPTSAGDATQFTPTGAALNYQCVDDIPPDDDTSYVESSTSGHQDLYGILDFTGTNRTIQRVQVIGVARDTSGAGQIYLNVKSGATLDKSAAISLTASYARYVGDDHTVDPNTSAAWTDPALALAQIGPEVV